LAAELVRRFTPDFRNDFRAWLADGGATEREVGFMPDLDRNPHVREAAELNARSSATYALGKEADDIADKYVRNTVLLATVLFLVAIAQRFRKRGLRFAVNGVAFLMLVYVVGSTATLPRLS
jgi:hypothetical protein